MLVELGDVATDQGDLDAASQAYERAIEIAGADAVDANERLRDLRVEATDWRSARARDPEAASSALLPAERAKSLVRAARVARRLHPRTPRHLLEEAYAADPTCDDAATLYEGLLVAQAREDSIVQTQRGLLQSIADPNRQAELALRFGSRWGYRHKKPQIAAQFVEETLRHQPDNEAAFAFLRDVYGTHLGDWSKVVGLADELGSRVGGEHAAFFLANAAAVAQELGDVERARRYYARLAEVAPQHTALARNRNAAGGTPVSNHSGLAPGAGNGAGMTAQRPEVSESDVAEDLVGVRSVAPLETTVSTSRTALLTAIDPAAGSQAPAYASERPVARRQQRPRPSTPRRAASLRRRRVKSPRRAASRRPRASEGTPSSPPEVRVVSAAGIAELREQLAKQESQNRVHELVKTLVALGDAVTDTDERVRSTRAPPTCTPTISAWRSR